ncbi:hypothetical protein NQ318_022913 [Aromia moschata]|uniref:BTB domain-containing protein n=1 Tax=Aromia moschata TaxID=1265417 RepID=A0AAV8YD19_9CUCU|nr:hypothetical protein NQ318_022913 [Aromia moschata]
MAVILQTCPQFVKLSDLECQKPRVEMHFTPRMSRSIPESSWVESPLLMSHSVGYRSAPHPLEPETSETNSDSDSVLQSSISQPKKLVRKLGTDLLRMFLEEIGPDVTVEVEGHKLKAHKCILASRCQYFAALLSGNWLEKSGNIISLQGFSYESVYFSLCHIYSGAAHVPDSISLVELASLADMLGLEGLKEVVEHALKQRHCHNFHKPCAGCCTGVLEVLPLSAAYGLDDLYQKCLQWITQHFVRVWPSRAFASLPRELRDKCYQQHVVHMNPDRVLGTILACDKILATLPSMRWAEPVSQLVLQLTDACHLYHRQHFAAVLGSHYVLGLDSGLGFGVCQIEDQMLSAAKNLGVDQACRSYSRCCKMLDQNWTRPFADLLNKIKLQLEQCLVGQADRLIRSNAWLRLDTSLRKYHVIQEEEESLYCDSCQVVTHANFKCSGVSTTEVRAITLQKRNLLYFCQDCRDAFKTVPKFIREMKNMQNEIDDLKEQIKELKQKKPEPAQDFESMIYEYEDRKVRARNVMIFNLPESQAYNVQEQCKEDTSTTKNILGAVIDPEKNQENKVGKTGSKPRPIKVILDSENDAIHNFKEEQMMAKR